MKTCGIIGWMWPSATVDCMYKIVASTSVTCDQDHIRVITDNNAHIPSRLEAIAGLWISPISAISETIDILHNAWADFFICPCNTAHYFMRTLFQESYPHLRFIDMINETARACKEQWMKRVWLLATTATCDLWLYQISLEAEGIELIVPSTYHQQQVMEAIMWEQWIKAGKQYETSHANKKRLLDAVLSMMQDGIDAVILWCTEIPLAIWETESKTIGIPFIDATTILAQAVVKNATHS